MLSNYMFWLIVIVILAILVPIAIKLLIDRDYQSRSNGEVEETKTHS